MTADCTRVDAVIDEVLPGGDLPPDLAAHLATCLDCQARLALARRIEQALAAWPVPVPPPHFSAVVAGRARRDVWRQEVVVDWGFNIALAASLVLVAGGAASLLWMLGALADPNETARVTAEAVSNLLGRVRGQGLVVVTATVLLATTAGAWWWAEERRRW
jgi:hypothetical protein